MALRRSASTAPLISGMTMSVSSRSIGPEWASATRRAFPALARQDRQHDDEHEDLLERGDRRQHVGLPLAQDNGPLRNRHAGPQEQRPPGRHMFFAGVAPLEVAARALSRLADQLIGRRAPLE
jgi:hypothetical protein